MTDRPLVGLSHCDTYDRAEMAAALRSALEPLGGMSAFVSPGDTVFLKVNLLMKATPDRAVTTHPELVRAVIREAFGAGAASVAVGDSPAGRTTSAAATAIFEAAGLTAVCRSEGATLSLLDEATDRVQAQGGRLFTSFELGRAAVDADVLINLPKLKTHGFMMYTGAVKNLFGCIPGLAKAQFHIKVPDRDDFAEMLVDLLLACAPELTVMDAVMGMEGRGPSGGDARHVGLVLASADAVALDVIASSIVGFAPDEVYTNRAAARRGLGPADVDGVEVLGGDWRESILPDFQRPGKDLAKNLPPAVARRVRTFTAARPRLDRPADCNRCGTCVTSCPVDAVTLEPDGGPRFDRDTCICCYCCQELCPRGAIGLRSSWLTRLFSPTARD